MPTTAPALPDIHHHEVVIGGVRIFYRDAGPTDGIPLLLLHGFPSASHQFRRLIDALGTRHRLIAPDYPGFGHSDAPASQSDGGSFTYSFDTLATIMEAFVEHVVPRPFAAYVFDFGAPIGMRLAERHPDWIAGLIVQNGNLYERGLSPAAREFTALRRGVPGAQEQVREILTLAATRSQYETGASDVARIAPDGWTLDQHFLDLPGRAAIQTDLLLDYHSNIAAYPRWQAWLREHQPPTLVVWGTGDPFFVPAGADALARDVPAAKVHLFDTGHFALEEELPRIAPLIDTFLLHHLRT